MIQHQMESLLAESSNRAKIATGRNRKEAEKAFKKVYLL